jgi:hypothetical protein
MKLYLLKQHDNTFYDTYNACVVCAENEADAKTISPDDDVYDENCKYHNTTWAKSLAGIECEEIGEAKDNQKRGLIMASFQAG